MPAHYAEVQNRAVTAACMVIEIRVFLKTIILTASVKDAVSL